MIHAGIIVMMIGELITGLYQVESTMQIYIGESENKVTQAGSSDCTSYKISTALFSPLSSCGAPDSTRLLKACETTVPFIIVHI